MKILVIGSGGREHAICRALLSGEKKPQLFIAPGNPGTATCGTNIDIQASDLKALTTFASENAIDLVVPGPELTLVLGISDAMQEAGIPCCGPAKAPARLEGSKQFTRLVADAVDAPSPKFAVCTNTQELEKAIANWDGIPVVKADGLASGKGVFLPNTKKECLQEGLKLLAGSLADAGKTVVLEERLEGVEVSLFYACSGTRAVALPHARDHKRLLDDDRGPNTGGMGAISPNPTMTPELEEQILNETILPTLRHLEASGAPFKGFLFAGLMLTSDGPKLLEYNVRLGDPETQAILPRLKDGDFLELCLRTATERLEGFHPSVDTRPTCTIVLAAHGYPENPRKGDTMDISPQLETADRWLIHAGTKTHDGSTLTNGGRVAAVVARGSSLSNARTIAYEGAHLVEFNGLQIRRDIGATKSTEHTKI